MINNWSFQLFQNNMVPDRNTYSVLTDEHGYPYQFVVKATSGNKILYAGGHLEEDAYTKIYQQIDVLEYKEMNGE